LHTTFDINIPHGNVATRLWCDGRDKDAAPNFSIIKVKIIILNTQVRDVEPMLIIIGFDHIVGWFVGCGY